jgi:hypothetical protein
MEAPRNGRACAETCSDARDGCRAGLETRAHVDHRIKWDDAAFNAADEFVVVPDRVSQFKRNGDPVAFPGL